MVRFRNPVLPPEDDEGGSPRPKGRLKPLARALELPVLRLQIRDKDGQPQQATMHSTLQLQQFPITPAMRAIVLEAASAFWAQFDCTVEGIELITHQSWEL